MDAPKDSQHLDVAPAKNTGTEPDTRDMKAVHNVFRNALSDPQSVIGRVDAGSAAVVDTVAQYYSMVLDFLHAHHGSEDEIVWPVLLPRCTVEEAAMVSAGEAQHAAVSKHLAASHDALAAWRAAPSGAAEKASLISVFADLRDTLLPHLSYEENHVMPLVRKYLTPEEYGKVPGGTMQKLSPENLFTCIGYVRGQFNDELLAAMDMSMPPPVAAGWAEEGKATYEAMNAVMAPLLHGHTSA